MYTYKLINSRADDKKMTKPGLHTYVALLRTYLKQTGFQEGTVHRTISLVSVSERTTSIGKVSIMSKFEDRAV